MTTEELLIPRWKVIADFPGNRGMKIGDILKETHKLHSLNSIKINPNCNPYRIIPSKYPAIFKKLEWWEERDEKDMPLFLKYTDGKIYPVSKYWSENHVSFATVIGINVFYIRDTLPSTKEEYEQQFK